MIYYCDCSNKQRVAWRNESQKKHVNKKGSKKAMRKVEATASFDEGSVTNSK